MNAWNQFSRNTTPLGNVYPSAYGPTLGARASAQSPATGAAHAASAEKTAATDGATATLNQRGFLGQPLTWWAILVAALFGLMLLAQRVGDDSDFGNVRLSVYNVVTISLAAVIGISFFKVLFARFPIPGLSDLVNAV